MGAYSSAVLADSPWLYYRLNETTGTSAADSSGNGRNGTYATDGGSYTLGVTPAAVNDDANAAHFNGAYASAPYTFLSGPASIEAWVRIAANPAADVLVTGCTQGLNSAFHDKELGIDSSGRPFFYIFDGVQKRVTGTALTLNTWYHLVGTCSAADGFSRLYVNGTQAASTAAGDTYTGYGGSNVFVAGRSNVFGEINADIDEVAFYTTVLSSTRVAAHYAAALGSYDPATFVAIQQPPFIPRTRRIAIPY